MPTIEIKPQPKQSEFLKSKADIAIYGGSAGGGKSFALLLEPLYHIHNSQFGAIVFRRTFPEIRNQGGLLDESNKVYPAIGATLREVFLEWKFPSGATVKFSHLQHDKDKLAYQGSQIPLIAFDELTHFSEETFFYLLSRNRSTCGVRPYVRATCNPDADSWVAKLIDWWIDAETGFPIAERSGILRWFVRWQGELIWGDSEGEMRDRFPGLQPKSLTFIPAKITDNPILLSKDSGYIANLQALHPVDRARLLEGNWRVRMEAGKVFSREWYQVIEPYEVPPLDRSVRFWDLAATEGDVAKDKICNTAGVKVGFHRNTNTYYILDCVAEAYSPGRTDELIRSTASLDGTGVPICHELEPGATGIRDAAYLRRLLLGYQVSAIAPAGSKILRCKPHATAASHQRVKLVRASWNDSWLDEHHSFPKGLKDRVDASSGAFNYLNSTPDPATVMNGYFAEDDGAIALPNSLFF